MGTGAETWTYLVRVGRRDKKNRTGLRNPPGATRHDLLEEGVDEVADNKDEEVVLPVHHGVELLLRLVRGSLVDLLLVARGRRLLALLGGHRDAWTGGIDAVGVASWKSRGFGGRRCENVG